MHVVYKMENKTSFNIDLHRQTDKQNTGLQEKLNASLEYRNNGF